MPNDHPQNPLTADRWQQIKDVLGEALERPLFERATFLDHVCRGDLNLRAEVESLMAYEQSEEKDKELSGAYLQYRQSPLSALCHSETFNLESDESADGTNRRIGPYKIVSELGRGGMGVVYMAERADDQYRREVAIKLIRRGMDTDFVLRRFRNERQILAGLDHPNIAKLLDGGATEDGLPYLVMEYVAGIPIDDYCDQHALDTHQRLGLFQKVCGAIHYAHQCQVIHRDIKPSNILVGKSSGLKLLDFGIAKLLTPELAAQTLDPTGPALRLMTPAYASPEQVKGEPVTTTTDVYSLGVLLYELLTGHKPYRVKSQAPHEISQAVLEQEPVKPSTAIQLTEETLSGDGSTTATLTPESVSKSREGTPDRLRRRLRGDLDDIVLCALRKDPRRRYASVDQFSEDIRRHLDGLPIIARKDSLTYRTTKFIRRNRVGVSAVILTLFLLAAVALVTSLWTSNLKQSGAPARTVAVLPFRNIGQEPVDDLGRGIADAIILSLTNIRGLTVRPMRSSLKYGGATQDPLDAGRALRVDAVLEGTISKTGDALKITAQLLRVEDGSRLWELKSTEEIETLLKVQDVIPAEVAQGMGLKLTPHERTLATRRHTASPEAYNLYLRGRHFFHRRTVKDTKQAIECFEQAIKIDPSYALAYSGLAHIHFLGNHPLEPYEAMQKAKAAAVKALELDETIAEAHMSLGRAIIYCDWDWTGSEKAFKRAIELSPNYSEAHFWYSHNLTVLGRHEEALSELKSVLEIDPSSPRNTLGLGYALHAARQYERAIEEFRKTPFEVDSAYYQVYWRLGLAYAENGRYDEALATLKKAELLSGESPLAKASIAYVYAKSGNAEEARRVLGKLEGGLTEAEGPFITLAGVYGCLGEKDKAFKLLEKLYERRDPGIIGINVLPVLDSVRAEPRFENLVRRIGLVPKSY